MKQRYYLIFGIIVVLVILLMVFFPRMEIKENPKIGDIILNPGLYKGKTVILEGEYGGWRRNPQCDYEKMGIVTRSDVIIYDDTGCLYICAACYGIEYLFKEGDISPSDENTYGRNIKIRALVDIDEGKPILGKIP